MIHNSILPPRALGIVRAVVFAAWFFMVLGAPLSQLADLPVEIFQPIGLVHLVPESAYPWLFQPVTLLTFQIVLLAGLGCCALGLQPYRPLAICTVLLLIFQQGLIRGYCFIHHLELSLLLATIILAIFPAGRGFAPGRAKPDHPADAGVYPLALKTITLMLLLPYTLIGIHRVVHSSPQIFLDGTMTHYLQTATLGRGYYGFDLASVVIQYPLALALLNAGFFVVTMMEVLSLLCLVSPRFRLAWVAVMIPFHLSTLFLMNIFFWHNLLLIGLLLTDLDKAAAWLRRRVPSCFPRPELNPGLAPATLDTNRGQAPGPRGARGPAPTYF